MDTEEQMVGPHKPGEQELPSFCTGFQSGNDSTNATSSQVRRHEVITYRGYTVDDDAIAEACVELIENDSDYKELYEALGEHPEEKNGDQHPCRTHVGMCQAISDAYSVFASRVLLAISVLIVDRGFYASVFSVIFVLNCTL